MNQQYPPQPQQPQPGWGPQQPYGQPPFQPPPPKKPRAGKIIGLGCLGIVGLFVLIGVIAGIAGSGGSDTKSGGTSEVEPATSPAKAGKPAADNAPSSGSDNTGKKKTDKKTVVFKVWGTAPAGALGPLDVTYGSDSDNRKGNFKNGTFEATLPLNDDALYFTVMAQLQGSGDIQCSVTVDGKTKKAHASGDYNICNAQLSSGLLGGWD